MSKETAALLSSTVDDISQGIDSVDISDNDGISAAAVCDMSSRKEDTISEGKKCTSCEQKLDNVKTNEIEVDNTSGGVKSDTLLKEEVNSADAEVSTCANCGKEGALNVCNKCKQVKYCNAACKKKHKTKHKADCEELIRRAAELHEEELRQAAELRDKELFKQPPLQYGDCPICNIRLPYLITGSKYQPCCGKIICSGCVHAIKKSDEEDLCPSCRSPSYKSSEELIGRIMKCVELNDTQAICSLGDYHAQGVYGLSQDVDKALELWYQAAELGDALAYFNIGCYYFFGRAVRRDMKKARNYFELATMGGNVDARRNLGVMENNEGNIDRAVKHYSIAIEGGNSDSVKDILNIYNKRFTTKDVYARALRAYQKYLAEVKSIQRDEAAAHNDAYKYY